MWTHGMLTYSFSLSKQKQAKFCIYSCIQKHLLNKCYIPKIEQIWRRQRQGLFLGIEETVNKISKYLQSNVQQRVREVVKEMKIRHSCNMTLTTGFWKRAIRKSSCLLNGHGRGQGWQGIKEGFQVEVTARTKAKRYNLA